MVEQKNLKQNHQKTTQIRTKYEDEVRVCIAIQKIGQATPSEIEEKLKEESIEIEEKKVIKICNNLQKKGIVSLNYDNSSGILEKAYSLAKSIFSRDIPIAQYKDIVDTSNPDIKKLIDELEQKKGATKGRLPDYRNYYMLEVKFEVVDKVLGFMPFTKEGYLEFYRQGKDIVFLPIHFRAYIGVNLRLFNKPESIKNYIGYAYGYAEIKGKMGIEQFPILDGHQGRGINKYEVMPKGSIIKTKFRVPETLFKKTEFKEFLESIGEMPIRGFGGRAATGYGHLKVIEYKTI